MGFYLNKVIITVYNSNKMASQTPGIQQLLLAEKKASEKVAEARKLKSERIKAAKEEAKAEIELFKQQYEKSFREKEAVMLGSRDEVKSQMERHQAESLQRVLEQTALNKDVVIERLLQLVCMSNRNS